MSLKSKLICSICKLVLSCTPVTLPCSHVMCNEHLRDGTAKDSSIRCLKCDQELDVPSNGFPPNKIASNFLTKDLHLSDEEKTLKYAMQNIIHHLERLQFDSMSKISDLERFSFDHFSEVRRQIDLQREELKRKIDDIALKMIDLVKEKEKIYNSAMKKQFILAETQVDIEESRRILENTFRNPNLVFEEVQRLQNEHEQKFREIRTRLITFDSFGRKIKAIIFKPGRDSSSFGILTAEKTNDSIACASDKKIILRDLVFNDSAVILEGHKNSITCLETIDENHFASGSLDKTIRIWDSKQFVCLKILTGHPYGVFSLKNLTLNKLASGSYGEIKIWDIERGKCLKTLYGHSHWIRGIVYLPNGNLVSCSDDRSVKVWDLARKTCIKTIRAGVLDAMYCIVLLRNGQLASGSRCKTIKIWNMENGECVKTLLGHSNTVWRLEQLDSGELVSCSSDRAIKIWNLEEGTCIRTLKGHTSSVTSIRVNSQNNTLVSCSEHGAIKIWNMKTDHTDHIDECVNTIDVNNECTTLVDFIFI